jgi:alanine racemase
MTHFAAADDPGEDDFTRQQIRRFRSALDAIAGAGIALECAHAANTAAAWRFPEARFDMVRVGLGLYGLHPGAAVAEIAADTRPALQLATRITQIRRVEAGETVGYGRSWRAPGPRTLATIAIGYNDGLPRFMSNGGEVLVGGRRCPIVGRVCMDATMVDITGLDARAGDEVVVFGRQGEAVLPIEEIAARGQTISYEILCMISGRVRRIFVQR